MQYRRRSDDPILSNLPSLAPNTLWLQLAKVLEPILKDHTYRPEYYVDVELSDKLLADYLMEKLAIDGDPACLLLVGQYGVGKTSLIRHLIATRLQPSGTFSSKYLAILFDAKAEGVSVTTKVDLTEHLANCTSGVVEHFLSAKGFDPEHFVHDVFQHEPGASMYRLVDSSVDRNAVVRDLMSSSHGRLMCCLRYLCRQKPHHKVLLIIDNVDQLTREFQVQAASLLTQLAASCSIKGILAIRDTTDWDVTYRHPEVTSTFSRTRVLAPSMLAIVHKRLDVTYRELLARHPEIETLPFSQAALRSELRDASPLSTVLRDSFSSETTKELVEGLSNGSVRDCLDLIRDVLSSGHLGAERILVALSPVIQLVKDYTYSGIPHHAVLKCATLRSNRMYWPDRGTWLPNVFSWEPKMVGASPAHCLLKAQILTGLLRTQDGVADKASYATRVASIVAVDPTILEKTIHWMSERDLVRTPEHRWLALTARGQYLASVSMYDLDYLGHVATDVHMHHDMAHRLVAPPDTFVDRLGNLLLLLDFLLGVEHRMLKTLGKQGLTHYAQLVGHVSFAGRAVRNTQARARRLHQQWKGSDQHVRIVSQLQLVLGYLKNYEKRALESEAMIESHSSKDSPGVGSAEECRD